MPGIKVYPGIAPGSTEFFYKDIRVQLVPKGLPLDETVHSVYKCTELYEQQGTSVKCPFIVTIKDVVEGRGKYVTNGSHNHSIQERCKGYEAFYRSVMYNVAQMAHPDQDLKQLLIPMVPLFGNRTNDEVEQIYNALESQRTAAVLRGGVVHWNSTPFNVPREAQPKVHLNNFGSVAHDPGVVQPFPQQRWCRSCSKNRACVVVLGCGHLCYCYGCAAHVKKGSMQCCPKCNGRVLDGDGKLQMQLIT